MIFSNSDGVAVNREAFPFFIENSTVMGKGRLLSTRIFQVAVLNNIFLICKKSFPPGKLSVGISWPSNEGNILSSRNSATDVARKILPQRSANLFTIPA